MVFSPGRPKLSPSQLDEETPKLEPEFE